MLADKKTLDNPILGTCFFVLIFLFIYSISKISPPNILPEVLSNLPLIILFLLYQSLVCINYIKIDPDSKSFYITISAISLLICLLYFVYKFINLIYKQNDILKQMKNQKEYSEKALTNDEELRKFRHDYRNHMIVINSLFENGQTDRARDYINNLNNSVASSLTKISTGNFITDAIINNKTVTASTHDIKIKFNGQVPTAGIFDEDLCTVFANVLDNAIEATQKLATDKVVKIDCGIRNGIFLLDVTNPVDTDVKIRRDGTIRTTKLNKAEHGLGIQSINRTVKKYNGSVNITCENKLFNIGIMMKLNI